MKSRKMLVAGVAAVAIAMSAVPASALTFTFTDTGGAAAGSQARAGFEAAAFYWSSVISTNANVTFDIGFKSLDAAYLVKRAAIQRLH